MEVYHLQQLREGFGPQDTMDYKYETLVEITKYFFLEDDERLKDGIRDSLVMEYKNLIDSLQIKAKDLEARLCYIVRK